MYLSLIFNEKGFLFSFQNLTVSDVKVLINVVRALDIPVRDDVQPAG